MIFSFALEYPIASGLMLTALLWWAFGRRVPERGLARRWGRVVGRFFTR